MDTLEIDEMLCKFYNQFLFFQSRKNKFVFISIRETATRISEIINEVGEASARAQGLSKPVTTAQKLRNSDHVVYIISENSGRK